MAKKTSKKSEPTVVKGSGSLSDLLAGHANAETFMEDLLKAGAECSKKCESCDDCGGEKTKEFMLSHFRKQFAFSVRMALGTKPSFISNEEVMEAIQDELKKICDSFEKPVLAGDP